MKPMRSLGIKRWINLSILGVTLVILGTIMALKDLLLKVNIDKIIAISIGFLGIVLIIVGIKKYTKVLINALCNYKSIKVLNKNEINEILHKENTLPKGPRIVVMGGGTGLSVLLRGLKEHTSNITAIVTVADDGGSSGVLREELGILPPGDIRNCLLALADTEPTLDKVLRYRFTEGSLKGQNFGNLFLAAMNNIYGDFNLAIKEIGNVLAVKGKVLPMTIENIKLYAELENGEIVCGESKIPKKVIEKNTRIKKIFTEPKKAESLDDNLEEIRNADCIVLGPGSLYTSIIPNLLINKVSREIKKSKAIKMYIGNIMTQPGETDNYTMAEHIDAIYDHSKEQFLDYVIVNDKKITEDQLEKYREDGSTQIKITKSDEEELKEKNISVIRENLVKIESDSIRHSGEKLSEIILDKIWESKVK